jgi:hypothetical protein
MSPKVGFIWMKWFSACARSKPTHVSRSVSKWGWTTSGPGDPGPALMPWVLWPLLHDRPIVEVVLTLTEHQLRVGVPGPG